MQKSEYDQDAQPRPGLHIFRLIPARFWILAMLAIAAGALGSIAR